MEETLIIPDILNRILENFDFTYMFSVNLLTYFIIKVIDYFNGDKTVSTFWKRFSLVIAIIILASIYSLDEDTKLLVIVNSSILAPLFYSWILYPILKKLGVNYKEFDDCLKM